MTAQTPKPHALLLILLLAPVLLPTACGDASDDGNDEQADATLVSESGHFEAHVSAMPAEPVTGENTLHMHLMDPAGTALDGATVAVEPWMPAHGHGSPETSVVEEGSDGMYTISNVVYSMPGHWEVRIDISHGESRDRIVAEFDVK